ncbi:DUF502 domain-containing protein [Mameliella sp. CS4]|uniref:DUF502 domain-containing protein n=1 Tax=Mameliella sp. CS4 TaxID=2862329 RepID=UPI001C5E9D32|nr:DUF502 domain-containing protein [Mameliella sp. CS4]MBW4983480.1 DUF502 domain-containing protein [Mameliella sp. CS4]
MTTPFEPTTRKRPGLFTRLRTSFLTGIVVIAPVGLTVWLIWTVVGWVDGFVWPFVPDAYQPNALLNRWMTGPDGPRIPWLFDLLDADDDGRIEVNVRGLGVFVFLFFTIVVGWIAKGLIGRSMISFAESLVERTPVVRSIYSGLKQLAETIFAQTERSFEKACLIEYPRKGIWAIGFISTAAKGEVARRAVTSGELMSVFVPTTPNPTSGFLLFFPKEDVIELDMSLEDAAKLVISAGLVYPNGQDAKQALEAQFRKAS